MGIGKIASQVAHASIIAVEKTKTRHPNILYRWLNEGQAKIVLKVFSLEELLQIKKKAENQNLVVVIVHDSGLTQLPLNTIACMAIGPDEANVIDRLQQI